MPIVRRARAQLDAERHHNRSLRSADRRSAASRLSWTAEICASASVPSYDRIHEEIQCRRTTTRRHTDRRTRDVTRSIIKRETSGFRDAGLQDAWRASGMTRDDFIRHHEGLIDTVIVANLDQDR